MTENKRSMGEIIAIFGGITTTLTIIGGGLFFLFSVYNEHRNYSKLINEINGKVLSLERSADDINRNFGALVAGGEDYSAGKVNT